MPLMISIIIRLAYSLRRTCHWNDWKREALKMAHSAYSRRALTLAFVCAVVLTVAAEASLKDGTRIRLSNEEVEEKLQVGVNSIHCFIFVYFFSVSSY
jgi:hypothetical protein